MKAHTLLALTAAFAVLLCARPSAAQPTFVESPVSAAYADYLARGAPPGYVPSPLDLSHLVGQRLQHQFPKLGYPEKFDLRTSAKQPLPAIRNQGNCGACWTFAALGVLEIALRPEESWNFSENNLKHTHGWDRTHCEGGNNMMAAAYLLRWSGPVIESEDPYSVSSYTSPPNLKAKKHVQHAYYLPDRASATDNGHIKDALQSLGAVMTSMYFDEGTFSEATDSYYYTGTEDVNHGVIIVGWDDTFSRTRFTTQPPGDGAFIVRNSYGEDFGDQGYFYVSYYDARIATNSMALPRPEPTENYASVYQYDPLGTVTQYGIPGSETAWFANVFQAKADERPAAIGFHANALNSRYSAWVYANVTGSPTSGTLIASTAADQVLGHAGFHTIKLGNVASVVRAGTRFSVVVKLTTPGTHSVIPIEAAFAGVTSGATAAAGQGFVSSDGSSWTDVTKLAVSTAPSASISLKAYTALACDDGNACTSDEWDGARCVTTQLTGSCDDGQWCNGEGTCSSGNCVPSGRDCSDNLTCTTDACDEVADECYSTPLSGWCVIAGACVQSGATNPANDCQKCDPARSKTAWSSTTGGACDDDDLCTDGDTCQSGTCRGTARTCDSGLCEVGDCNPATGQCELTAVVDGRGCNDNNRCTFSETCQKGACVATRQVQCIAKDECHDPGQCNPENGVCSNPAKTDGAACSPGKCVGGVCVQGAPSGESTSTPSGCGCGASGAGLASWALLSLVVLRRRGR